MTMKRFKKRYVAEFRERKDKWEMIILKNKQTKATKESSRKAVGPHL